MDTYNKHITRGFSDGLACGGERWTLITSTLRDASVMGKPVLERWTLITSTLRDASVMGKPAVERGGHL